MKEKNLDQSNNNNQNITPKNQEIINTLNSQDSEINLEYLKTQKDIRKILEQILYILQQQTWEEKNTWDDEWNNLDDEWNNLMEKFGKRILESDIVIFSCDAYTWSRVGVVDIDEMCNQLCANGKIKYCGIKTWYAANVHALNISKKGMLGAQSNYPYYLQNAPLEDEFMWRAVKELEKIIQDFDSSKYPIKICFIGAGEQYQKCFRLFKMHANSLLTQNKIKFL